MLPDADGVDAEEGVGDKLADTLGVLVADLDWLGDRLDEGLTEADCDAVAEMLGVAVTGERDWLGDNDCVIEDVPVSLGLCVNDCVTLGVEDSDGDGEAVDVEL